MHRFGIWQSLGNNLLAVSPTFSSSVLSGNLPFRFIFLLFHICYSREREKKSLSLDFIQVMYRHIHTLHKYPIIFFLSKPSLM